MQDADLVSAFLGLGAAIAFGWPAFLAVRAKRYYEAHQKLLNAPNLSQRNKGALQKLGRRVAGMQLGGANEAFVSNMVGAILLGSAFIFLFLAALERRADDASRSTDQSQCTATARTDAPARKRPDYRAESDVPSNEMINRLIAAYHDAKWRVAAR